MAVLASDWLRHFQLLLWNCLTEFNETWQEARSQCPQPSLWFSGRSEKEDGSPGLWLAETFSTSPLKPPNRIQRNLTGSKISTSSTILLLVKFRWIPFSSLEEKTKMSQPIRRPVRPPFFLIGQKNTNLVEDVEKFVFFWPIGKTKWPSWPLIGWDIFNFSSETAERNST